MGDDIPTVKTRFQLRQIVATLGAVAATDHNYRLDCLMRHVSGDWDCCNEDDKVTNDDAVTCGNRIRSAYPVDPAKPSKGWGDNTLWIITEADRSVTTFLLPGEY